MLKNLAEARIRVALSQAELANKLNVSQGQISNWERCKSKPSANQEKKLRIILGIDGENSTSDVSPLAAWLSKARAEKRLSIPEFAHKAGLTPPAIYRIEAGVTRNLRAATRSKLEAALGSLVPDDTAEEVKQEAEIQGLGALEDFDPHNDDERPKEPGIYVLYDISERPIYVGEGSNVRRRIKDHEEKFWFRRPIVENASWIRIDDEKLRAQIETLLIKFLKSNAVINKQNVER